ncbi:uncharacterized protein LOC127368167 isoform X2 [Dicentrarchus labrax]|uniref:uncharacterized protein LOC127368167 isoform X2 n=1 Tax=Dicentrarchus labrax TaxID=13489 RepID=UPI0021F56300|nr:uncharacterized protein LOC127368167 isoform X2 [Dicentrarchus labrax]
MAGIVHIAIGLLLFSFIRTGVNGEDGLIFEQRYDITFPCEDDLVCFHIWHFAESETSPIAVVTNGEILTANSEYEDSKCTLHIKDLTTEDVGRHHCHQKPDVFSPHKTTPDLNLMPGKTLSLQCVLLTYIEQRHCHTQLQQVSLAWVDESGAEIQENSQHQIKQKSLCDVTLTVTFQSPEDKKFRCQATVDEQVQTSAELWVRVPGRGRGFIIELEPENQGNQLPDESCYTASTNNVTNADDVIYAEVSLPVGSGRLLVHECESTEYACVQYK